MSKKSIPAWLKQNNGWGGPYEAIVGAITYYAHQGDHPDIAFEGSTLELATELYTTHAKKAGAAGGLYCTGREVAEKMAKSLNLRKGHVVLNPGSGLHSLTQAVRTVEPRTTIVCVECQDWLVKISQAVGLPVIPGDFESGVMLREDIDAVIVNPPWGKLWGSNQIEREFMSRIAAVTQPSVRVAALLPGTPGHFFEKLTNGFAPLRSLYAVIETEFYPDGAALPKSLPCTRYLLERV